MSCESIDAQIVAFHFGGMPRGEAHAVERHLLDCRRCCASYFAAKNAADAATSGSEMPSPKALERLLAALPRTVRTRRHLVAYACAAAVLLALACSLVLRRAVMPDTPVGASGVRVDDAGTRETAVL